MDEQVAELTDEAITAFIADPATIPDHGTALQILDCLEAEIINIQAQLDQAAAESSIRPLSPERIAWQKRASYACAMRRNERHKVFMRDKEIRGTKIPQRTKTPEQVEEKRLKQIRLTEEAQARRAQAELKKVANQKQMEAIRLEQMRITERKRELAAESDFRYRFHLNAKAMLPTELYEQIAAAPLPAPPTTPAPGER